MAWAWTGVGVWYPASRTARNNSGKRSNSENVVKLLSPCLCCLMTQTGKPAGGIPTRGLSKEPGKRGTRI